VNFYEVLATSDTGWHLLFFILCDCVDNLWVSPACPEALHANYLSGETIKDLGDFCAAFMPGENEEFLWLSEVGQFINFLEELFQAKTPVIDHLLLRLAAEDVTEVLFWRKVRHEKTWNPDFPGFSQRCEIWVAPLALETALCVESYDSVIRFLIFLFYLWLTDWNLL
jgi:hypothetical protein